MAIAIPFRDTGYLLRDPRRVFDRATGIQVRRADPWPLSHRLQPFFFLKPAVKLSQNAFNAVAAGGIAGFLAGLIGTGGAIRGLALAAFDLEKNIFVATSAAIDSGIDFSRMIVYLRSGFLSAEFYWYVPGLFLAAFAGSYAGKVALNKIEQRTFRKIVLLLVFIIGAITLGRFFQQLGR